MGIVVYGDVDRGFRLNEKESGRLGASRVIWNEGILHAPNELISGYGGYIVFLQRTLGVCVVAMQRILSSIVNPSCFRAPFHHRVYYHRWCSAPYSRFRMQVIRRRVVKHEFTMIFDVKLYPSTSTTSRQKSCHVPQAKMKHSEKS